MVLDPDKNVNPKCLFCNEDIGFDRTKRVRHIGRHMEEIAFAIVTKPYEKWDFYSVPSEKYLDGQGPWHSEPNWYPCTCHDCGLVELHTVAERAKHFVSIHGLSVAAARAQFGGGYQCHHSNNLEQRPCNTVYSSPVDLETLLFFHTKRIKSLCERCKQEDSRLTMSSYSYKQRIMLPKGQISCGLCG